MCVATTPPNTVNHHPKMKLGGAIRLFSGDGGRRARGARNSKGFDWYSKALLRLSAGKQSFEGVEMFPKQLGKRSRVFMDFNCEGKDFGRLSFTLVDDLLPQTCLNFKLLCSAAPACAPYKYEGTIAHRIVRDAVVLLGDVEHQNGKGGHSAFLDPVSGGKYFKDEAYVGNHDAVGVLSMTNGGIDTNNSQFFVTMQPQKHLNGRNIAFGYVDDGFEVLEKFNSVLTSTQFPLSPIRIARCGVLVDASKED